MSQYHVSVQEGSRLPPLQRCSDCCLLFHCPLCSPPIYKPAHRYKVHRHLQCHLARAVHFKGYNIYKCNLGCRPHAHFHCFCEKLFLNRNQFIHHLNAKHEGLPTRRQSVSLHDDPEQPPPLSQHNADPSPTFDSLSLCEPRTSDTFSNTAAASDSEITSAPSEEPRQSNTGRKNPAHRPQCNMMMNKRAFNISMTMRQSSRTSASTLKGHKGTTTDSAVGGSEYYHNPTLELDILSQLQVLQQQQNQILQLLLKLTNKDSVNDSTEGDMMAMLPITDEEGLANLELKLSGTPNFKNLIISCFDDNDGCPIDQTVQRILERMLSNNFAKRMDWRGKNNKISFASSCLKQIVNDAVRRNSVCARAADEAVESAVKKWLQQAAERDEAAEKRGDKGAQVHH
ncbi:nucleotide triphosphate diphosphatase NUDT15 isoform X2 [Echeneis naucrates]|uniref:nucleotide triphosphate diphosphatase NUDT15 isoform X2 n=1 Tax=Echeneis naucrates TaxID=173247 RepID=UPI0011145E10|nr:nucleotide triphosphate diphosphatase NUDT15 isoform X2 [Echeneis naucrates]